MSPSGSRARVPPGPRGGDWKGTDGRLLSSWPGVQAARLQEGEGGTGRGEPAPRGHEGPVALSCGSGV